MPIKFCSTRERSGNTEKDVGATESALDSDVEAAENGVGSDAIYLSPFPQNQKIESKSCLGDEFENDWRYLAVTAFLVKVAYSRSVVHHGCLKLYSENPSPTLMTSSHNC